MISLRPQGMLTTTEVAAALGVGVSSVLRAIERGALDHQEATIGRRKAKLVPVEAVEAYRQRLAGQQKRGRKPGAVAYEVRLDDLAPDATLSAAEAAGRTGRTRQTILAAIKAGKLAAEREVGGRAAWRVRVADLAAWAGEA